MSSNNTSLISTAFDSFLVFKRNAHFLYDIIISHVLAFPSLTFQFALPVERKHQARVPFVLTTHAPNEQNFVYRKCLQIPFNDQPEPLESVISSERGVFAGGYGSLVGVGDIFDEFVAELPSEANSIALARDNDILAVSCETYISIFDFTTMMIKQPEKKPRIILEGLLAECFTMIFDDFKLIAGDAAGKIVVYDLFNFTGKIVAQDNYQAAINAIAISPYFNDMMAIVTDAGELVFVDPQLNRIKAELLGDIIEDSFTGCSLAFSRFDEDLLAIGGENGNIVIYSIKSRKFHILGYHKGAVFELKFSPFYKGLLMSGSEDSRVCLWDIYSKKLLFVHAGHTCCISDCQFHPTIPNLIGSVAEDNSLEFWWPSANVFKIEQ